MTTAHWHGMHIPARFVGGPTAAATNSTSSSCVPPTNCGRHRRSPTSSRPRPT
ncbi:hypothetical protein [Phytoactinopolyspora endophytica]|uniref:hypothetical protein n=1 Tax=Phytoactinopolyspora endophytica TaxID=1642495 RepID=UPI00197B8FCC